MGKDRRNDVYQLGKARDFHAVRVVHKRHAEAREHERVEQRIIVFEDRRRFHPVVRLVLALVPDVPLIERKVKVFFAALLGLDIVCRGDERADKRVHVHKRSEKIKVVSGVLIIPVHGKILGVVVGVLHYLAVPLRERGHVASRAAADDQLHVRVDPLHDFCGFARLFAVVVGVEVADLPVAVHLVADAPQANVHRVAVAVFGSQIAPVRPARVVAVLHHLPGVFRRAGAHVDARHDFRACLAAPVVKLVDAEAVALNRPPGKVKPAWTLFFRADAVLPVIAGKKIAARVAHVVDAQLAHKRNDILAEALLIRFRVARLVDAAVNGTAEMFEERAEQPVVRSGNFEFFFKVQFGVFHKSALHPVKFIFIVTLSGLKASAGAYTSAGCGHRGKSEPAFPGDFRPLRYRSG